MELGNVSQPMYGQGLEAPGSSTPGLVGMAHGFLQLVQPKALLLDQNVTEGSLLDLAAELEQLTDKAGTDVKENLKTDARRLRELGKEMQTRFSGLLQGLKENIHLVQSGAAQLEAQIKATLDEAIKSQDFLDGETASIIKNETLAFLEMLLNFFETYISWAKSRLTRDVARCKPIAQALDNVETITCSYILDSLNAFWFSLGCCNTFLLPSIILAVRLAKFYCLNGL